MKIKKNENTLQTRGWLTRLASALAAALLCIVPARSFAYDGDEALSELKSAIPEEVIQYIPEDFELTAEGITSCDTGFLVRCAAKAALAVMKPVVSDLSLLLGTVILASVVKKISESVSGESLSTACGYASTLCVALPLIGMMTGLWERASESLGNLTVFMSALLPIMTSLYSAGGNFTAAATANASLTATFVIIESICTYCLYPVLRICFCIALLSCVGGGLKLEGVSSFIRGVFTTGLSFLMILFTIVMGYQNKLALATDNAAARTVRFAVSNLIPVVGGAAGEAMRAVIGGIGTVRSAAGTIAVIIIILTVLPMIVSLLLHRAALRFSGIAAQLLGLEKESSMIGEMYGMAGYVLAIVAVCSILFIFNVTLLVKSAVSISA